MCDLINHQKVTFFLGNKTIYSSQELWSEYNFEQGTETDMLSLLLKEI